MPNRIGGFDCTDINRKHGGSTTGHFPFEISKHTDLSGNLYVSVRPGTVSGLLPDNISDKLFIAKTGTFYIKLTCQTNGKVPTFVFLFTDSEPSDNDDAATQGSPPPAFELVLGIVKDNVIYQVIYNNLIANPDIVFLEIREPDEPTQEPFVRWWAWAIAAF